MIDEGEKPLDWITWLDLVRDVEVPMANPPSIYVGPRNLSQAVVVRMEPVSPSVNKLGGNLPSIDQICSGDGVDGSVEVY